MKEQESSLPPSNLPTMRWYLLDGNPVLWNELRRLLRGKRWSRLVVLDIVGLSAMLLYCLFTLPPQTNNDLSTACYHHIWQALMIAQAVIVLLLSPGLSAGAISGERERHTLEPLVLTPLSSRAIVYGKFWAAMTGILLLLLGGLPVMAVVFMLGGVSPWEVILSHIALLASMLVASALGLWASCRARRAESALLYAYLYTFLALIGAPCISYICIIHVYIIVALPCITLWALSCSVDLLEEMRNPAREPPPLPEINEFGFPIRPAKKKSQ